MELNYKSLYDWEKAMDSEKAYSELLKLVNRKMSLQGLEIKKLMTAIGNDINVVKEFLKQYMNTESNQCVLNDDTYYFLIKPQDKILLKRDKKKSPKVKNKEEINNE